MELICPECLGVLVPLPDGSVFCQTHKGQYQVLFMREPPPPAPVVEAEPEAPEAPPYVPTVGATCYQHTTVVAVFACRTCGKPHCSTCAFRQEDGSAICPNCITSQVTPTLPAGSLVGKKCVQHPNVDALRQCKLCGAFMCETCDFMLPGNIHLCPACAAKPQTALSPKRKNMLFWAFALALWSTIGMVCVFCGAFAAAHRSASEAQTLEIMFRLFVLFPALAGLGLALSTRDRRLLNPPALWIALVWNALIVAIFLLLEIVGLMMKG